MLSERSGTATHICSEVLVVVFLLLVVRDRLDLLWRLGRQSLELRGVHRVDVVLLNRDFDRHFVLVRAVRLDNAQVFADLVRALGSPRLWVSSVSGA